MKKQKSRNKVIEYIDFFVRLIWAAHTVHKSNLDADFRFVAQTVILIALVDERHQADTTDIERANNQYQKKGVVVQMFMTALKTLSLTVVSDLKPAEGLNLAPRAKLGG